MSPIVRFFQDKITWEMSNFQELEKAAKDWKLFATIGWGIAVIAIAAVIPLTVMHELVPVVATVDRATGDVHVRVGAYQVDMQDPTNETMMIADLGRYVKAREGFTRGEAETNYQTVWYMSSTDLRGAWDAEFLPERNKNALAATLSVRDKIGLENLSVQFLPTDRDDIRVAQVRFDKIREIGSRPPTIQRFISTITFKYDSSNIPKKVDGIVINPFGFTALNYREDAETEERQISQGTGGY